MKEDDIIFIANLIPDLRRSLDETWESREFQTNLLQRDEKIYSILLDIVSDHQLEKRNKNET